MIERVDRRLVVALAVALVAAGVIFAWLLSRGAPSPPSSPGRGAQTAARPLAPATEVQLDVLLRDRGGALTRYMDGLFDPSSKLYGRYLTPAEFGARFGLRAGRLDALEQRLAALGVHVEQVFPARTMLRARASAAAIRRDFGVTLRSHAGSDGRYIAPDRAARIPPALRHEVTGVAGLDTHLVPQLDTLPAKSGGALRPIDAQTGYDVEPLYSSANGSTDGHGQTIAVIGIDPFSMTDFEHYSNALQLGGPTPQTVVISKPSVHTSIEGDLDLETIHGIAPQAQIIDYQTSFADLPNAITDIVDAGKATIISGSFGICDGTRRDPVQLPSSFRKAVERALTVAAASGITFLFSTGDAGAYDCQRQYPHDTNLTVEFPSDAPFTLAVGGTVLSLNNDGSYDSETGWQDSGSDAGGGGGLNPYDEAPPWEADVSGISNGARETPDVSAAAGDASPWWVYDGKGSSGWEPIGGTSAAAPFWAASLLLVQQYMTAHGAGPLCFATPLLYDIARTSWRFAPFHDVELGGNRYYEATPGWDFATGWGSPNVFNLATAAVAYRQQHPLPAGGCTSSLEQALGG